MNRKTNSGVWAVVIILALGIVLALVGLKFRRFPEDQGKPASPGLTATRASDQR